MNKHFLILILLLIFINNYLSGQTYNRQTDSLKHVADTTKQDTVKANVFILIARDVYKSNPDSAINILKQALQLSKKENFEKGVIDANLWLGYLINHYGEDDSKALKYYKQALKLLEKDSKKNYKRISVVLNNIAYINDLRGNIPEALRFYSKSLKISEANSDSAGMIASLSNIATLYYTQGDTSNARKYINTVYEIQKKLNDKKGIANTIGLLGDFYTKRGKWDKGLEYYQKSLKICKEEQNHNATGTNLLKIGNVFLHKEEYDTALIYFNKSLEYQKSAKNKQGQMKSLYKIALIYYLQNDLINAEKNALKSLELAQNTGYPLRITDASSLLADIYKKQNNWEKAFDMYELSVKMRDSIGNAKNQKITLKRQMQYEYEKQAAIDSITFAKELEIKNLQAKKSRTQRNYMFAGLIVLTIFLIFIFKNYKQKQEANILLEKQKQEIQTQADNLQKANEEISRKNKNITDSINYASRIQAALLPSQNLFGKFFSDYFIFYKPKDIVSGDFYYLKQIDDFLVYAVADCTGHGVPGAFVSLLGIAFLNEIIRKKEVQTAAQILEELRYEVKMSLNKNNAESRTNDGMDIALCIINTNTKKLQFAGAYNPLYIIRNEELTEIEADKMPAGIFIKEDKPFTNNEIQLKKGDRLYMFSDGYIDQCRVACTKKYSTKHFKELLLNISSKPMQEQKNILEKTLNEGSGNYKQIDDILVTGIKI